MILRLSGTEVFAALNSPLEKMKTFSISFQSPLEQNKHLFVHNLYVVRVALNVSICFPTLILPTKWQTCSEVGEMELFTETATLLSTYSDVVKFLGKDTNWNYEFHACLISLGRDKMAQMIEKRPCSFGWQWFSMPHG